MLHSRSCGAFAGNYGGTNIVLFHIFNLFSIVCAFFVAFFSINGLFSVCFAVLLTFDVCHFKFFFVVSVQSIQW